MLWRGFWSFDAIRETKLQRAESAVKQKMADNGAFPSQSPGFSVYFESLPIFSYLIPPLLPCLADSQHIEPTPAEEAAARAKEAEEQAALPYKWTQTIGDVDISISVPGNFKGRDLNVDIKKTNLVAGIKGQEPIINVLAPLPALLGTLPS